MPIDLDSRPRLRGHPLRAFGHRHRPDHHRPPARPQRLPARDRGRAHRCLPPCARRQLHRRRAADRRGRRGLLLGRRHDRQGRGRLYRQRRHRPAQRPRPATAHPLAAHRRHRTGQRLRHRRRPRAPRRLRPDHRLGERRLRPDRPEGGQLRRRLRGHPAGAHRGPQEGARDVVPLPPVHGPGGAGHGARQCRRAARATPRRGRRLGRRDPGQEPDRHPDAEALLQRRHGRPGRASRSWPATRRCCST